MFSNDFYGNTGGYSPISISTGGNPWGYALSLSNSYNWQNNWYTGRQVITRSSEPEFSARRIFRDQFTGEYKVKERNGRIIVVGIFKVINVLVVNPKTPTEFDAVCFDLEYDDKIYKIVCPYKEYCKRQILQYLPFIKRNPDCKDEYLIAAVFLALQEYDNIQFLQCPPHSGWCKDEKGNVYFAASYSVHPALTAFYHHDIRDRQLLKTDRALSDIVISYRNTLAADNTCKLLALLRIYSILSRLISKQSVPSEAAFIVQPTDERCAKVAIALLKTDNYFSTSVFPLIASKSELKKRLDAVNDGIALFRDTALIEEQKRRKSSLATLHEDITGADGKESRGWHIIAIIEDMPGCIPPEFPAIHLKLPSILGILDVSKMQRISGEFDTALIKHIMQDPEKTHKELREAKDISLKLPNYMFDLERLNTIYGISSVALYLTDLGLFSMEDFDMFMNWLSEENETSESSMVTIINDFRIVLNLNIMNDNIVVVPQSGPPYFCTGRNMIIEDRFCVNLQAEILDKIILPEMRATRRRNTLLSALHETGYLHSNNNYKRLIEVEIAPGKKESISVYSIDKGMLDDGTCEKLREQELSEFFVEPENNNEKLTPIITNANKTKVAGMLMYDSEDVNRHQYISGSTRSGKTFYLCQQAVLKAAGSECVIIFDHSGAFSERELGKHLSSNAIDKYFDFWDISENGLPVDLMNLEDCNNMPDKKNRLLGILASGVRVLGDVQEKILKRRISAFLKECGDDPDVKLSKIFEYLDPSDSIQRKLVEKFYDVFDGLDDLESTKVGWGEFLKTRKKIIVISTSVDSVHKGTYLVDMLMSSLYSHKQYHPDERMTVILDEVEDQYLAADAPIDIMLRKGGKIGLTLILASQEFSVERDRLGKIIGNCGLLVCFRPKNDNLKDIAKLTGYDTSTLAGLEQGECVAVGNFCNYFEGKNKYVTLIGRTYVNHDIDDDINGENDINSDSLEDNIEQ